jgi:hypothetical protein
MTICAHPKESAMTNSSLFSAFQQIAQAGERIRLFNVYQGVPIAYPAEILQVESDSILVQTEKYQVACLYREKITYVQNHLLPGVSKAAVLELNVTALQARLGAFELSEGGIGDRMQVRVQPKDAISSNLKARITKIVIHGELADISKDGLGIYVPRRNFLATVYYRGAKVNAVVNLPGEFLLGGTNPSLSPKASIDPIARFDREQLRLSHVPGRSSQPSEYDSTPERRVHSPRIEVQGSIVNIYEEPEKDRIRLGIQIQPGDPAREIVAQFFSQRQSEIMRELKELSELLAQSE